MSNILAFALGLFVILLLARYNRSNKLFWILLISMLSGFVGGSIAAKMAFADKKKCETLQPSKMQASMISTALFADYTKSEDTRVVLPTKPASPITVVSDNVTHRDLSTEIYESDVGNLYKYHNTS